MSYLSRTQRADRKAARGDYAAMARQDLIDGALSMAARRVAELKAESTTDRLSPFTTRRPADRAVDSVNYRGRAG